MSRSSGTRADCSSLSRRRSVEQPYLQEGCCGTRGARTVFSSICSHDSNRFCPNCPLNLPSEFDPPTPQGSAPFCYGSASLSESQFLSCRPRAAGEGRRDVWSTSPSATGCLEGCKFQ